MTFPTILDKPFLVGQYEVTTSTTESFGETYIPSGILTNTLTHMPFRLSTYYRMRACFDLQLAGTPMHSGCIIAAVVPFGSPELIHPNQLMSAPHVFLNANESTPACLEIPFYAHSPVIPTVTSTTSSDYAKLVFWVLNPIIAASSASTSLELTITMRVLEADFYVPRVDDLNWDVGVQPTAFEAQSLFSGITQIPTDVLDSVARGAKFVTGDLIDTLRGTVKTLTGFHNPNNPTIADKMIVTPRNYINNIDQPSYYEKLDPYSKYDRITDDYYFHTEVDEMLMSNILAKPDYLGTFHITTSDSKGTLLCALPMSPCSDMPAGPTGGATWGKLKMFYEASRYWNGDLNVHFQTSMTNFQFCKIMVVRVYGMYQRPADFYPQQWFNAPRMNDVASYPSEIIELAGGGEIHTVQLPFVSPLKHLECTKALNTQQILPGMMYVYLLAPLAVADTAPISAAVNVYMSAGDNFSFYGYSGDNCILTNDIEFPVPPPSSEESFEAQSAMVDVASQNALLQHEAPQAEKVDDFVPIVSVRDYLRRVVPVDLEYWGSTGNVFINAIPIQQLLGYIGMVVPYSVAIGKLFTARRGGFKFKIVSHGFVPFKVRYVPPGMWATNYGVANGTIPFREPVNDGNSSNAYLLSFNGKSSLPGIEYVSTTTNLGSPYGILSTCEFSIPNMSPFDSNFTPNTLLGTTLAVGDFGYLVITQDTNVVSTVATQFYFGVTDETRLGHQVAQPGTSPEQFINLRNFYRRSNFNSPPNAIEISHKDNDFQHYFKFA